MTRHKRDFETNK